MSEKIQNPKLKLMLIDFKTQNREACLYYILSEIRSKLEFISSLRSENVKYLFPVKSFPHPTVLELASEYADGFDISNENEFNLIKSYLSDNSVVWSSAPYFLTSVQRSNTFIDINSLEALESAKDKSIVSLRLSTEFYRDESRFGLTSDEITQALKENEEIQAIHMHLSGVENVVDDYFGLLAEVKKITKDSNRHLNINFGGGFAPLSSNDIEKFIKKASSELSNHTIFFEPGRWVANNAGFAIGKVLNINKKYITMSLSPNCHLKWLEPRFNIMFPGNPNAETNQEIVISGPTCYENDTLTKIKSNIDGLKVGHNIIIDTVCGYCLAWNHSFNGVKQADIVFIN